jgi:hypothetical protein
VAAGEAAAKPDIPEKTIKIRRAGRIQPGRIMPVPRNPAGSVMPARSREMPAKKTG